MIELTISEFIKSVCGTCANKDNCTENDYCEIIRTIDNKFNCKNLVKKGD